MGKSQRTKGASYEREVAKQFSEAINSYFARNIGQSRDGGNDIDVGPLCIEAKRRKSLKTIESWMAQAQAAADTRAARGRIAYPVVVARQDAGESLIVFRLDDFLELFRDALREECERLDPPSA